MARLLIAEDDPSMGALLSENLRTAGYDVMLAADGGEAKRIFATKGADLCILDMMLPGKDGGQLAREIRELDPSAPFLFLTARNTQQDKQEGFKAGCDDYVTKPFDVSELLLRINAILERTRGPRFMREPVLTFGQCALDPKERTLLVNGKHINLTDKETRILHLLVNYFDHTVTRIELLQRVWGKDDPYHSKSMDVYLTRIRKYLRGDHTVELRTVHGLGYRLSFGTSDQEYRSDLVEPNVT